MADKARDTKSDRDKKENQKRRVLREASGLYELTRKEFLSCIFSWRTY